MPIFEYKVVPAPTRGLKAKGVKGTQARFANALQTVMNEMGADGWDYQRTDTLPVEERQGLTGKTTSFQNMLVFRRVVDVQTEDAPAITALIEDQSDAVAEHEAETDIKTDIAADAEAVADEISDAQDTQTDDAAPAQDANDRVSETLKSSYALPWKTRRAETDVSKDDDTRPAAE